MTTGIGPEKVGNPPHIVVAGAGIVGASIAFHLARRGARITVLDAASPGAGASSHSFAWINSFGKEPAAYHDLNRRSMDVWDRFARRLPRNVGLRWGGDLRWAGNSRDAEEIAQRVTQLQARGYPSRIVDESEMRRLEPGLAPGSVSLGALGDIDGQVDPPLVVSACLEDAVARGATIHPNTPVTGLRLAPSGASTPHVASVQTPNGDVPCDALVLAAGVQTTRLAAMAGVTVPQEESPGVTVRTDPQPRVLQTVAVIHTPALAGNDFGIHLRQGNDGIVMIGEGSQESLRRDDSQQHADRLLNSAVHFLPALATATAVPVPLGFRPMPADGFPVLGFTQRVPNLYLALMHSGVTLAPLVGELAAIELLDGARVEMLQPYRPERFL